MTSLASWLRRCAISAGLAGAVVAAVPYAPAGAQTAGSFPFNEELLLDARPMQGSKRVPILDIRADGAVLIELWCNSVQGQLVVAADMLTVLTGPRTERACSPERERGDREILSALEQVTSWRRDGDAVILIGPQKLRFRRATN